MSSMGAALAAAGTAAGAGAMSMAGMGGTGASSPTGSAFFLLPRFFDRVGLGVLNQLPNAIAQPLLVAFLTVSVTGGYLAYRGNRRPSSLALTVLSGIAMYVSIYVWMSEPLYLASLAGQLAAGVWGIFLAHGPRHMPGEPSPARRTSL
jgi:hypothetical protein